MIILPLQSRRCLSSPFHCLLLLLFFFAESTWPAVLLSSPSINVVQAPSVTEPNRTNDFRPPNSRFYFSLGQLQFSFFKNRRCQLVTVPTKIVGHRPMNSPRRGGKGKEKGERVGSWERKEKERIGLREEREGKGKEVGGWERKEREKEDSGLWFSNFGVSNWTLLFGVKKGKIGK